MAEKIDIPTDKTFQFDLVSPEAILVSKQVRMVTMPGTLGEFGVLADHAALLSSLESGIVTVIDEDHEAESIYISGGFADVFGDVCAVLATDAVKVEDIDTEELEKDLTRLKRDLGNTDTDAPSYDRLFQQMSALEDKIRIISNR